MNPTTNKSPIARIAFALLCAMWTATGWYLFLTETFSTAPIRSRHITTVNGPPAQFMGLIFVALGLIALAWLLRSCSVRRSVELVILISFFVACPLAMQAALGSFR